MVSQPAVMASAGRMIARGIGYSESLSLIDVVDLVAGVVKRGVRTCQQSLSFGAIGACGQMGACGQSLSFGSIGTCGVLQRLIVAMIMHVANHCHSDRLVHVGK